MILTREEAANMLQALMSAEEPSELILQSVAILQHINRDSLSLVRDIQQQEVWASLPDCLPALFVDIMENKMKPTKGWQHLYPLFDGRQERTKVMTPDPIEL